jgi:O-succinylbenzoic acid--CoA ligase
MGKEWLVGQDGDAFFEMVVQAIAELNERTERSPHSPVIFLAESDPVHFLAKFIAACTIKSHLFLCNPTWTNSEWAQLFTLASPNLIWADNQPSQPPTPNSQPPTPNPQPLCCIPTGGSSGTIRFAMHTWDTLMASVTGFQQYFEVDIINSCCVLPLYHVSGLMQCLRSLTSGGKLTLLPFKTLETTDCLAFDPADFFLSLVPTQLERLLQSANLSTPPRLLQFKTILLGGAPAGSELVEQARRFALPLAPTYGMTETASQVATLKPEDFLKGRQGVGQGLPHAQVTIRSGTGEVLGVNQTGLITIAAESLMLGYYPTPFGDSASRDEVVRVFATDDIGWMDEQGYLYIIGRQSDKIITGGENVYPAEVEAAILATGLVRDVGVIGISDRQWGQAIIALYIPITANLTAETLKAALSNRLSKFKLPKQWIAVNQLPRNAQGKLNRQKLQRWVPTTDSTK